MKLNFCYCDMVNHRSEGKFLRWLVEAWKVRSSMENKRCENPGFVLASWLLSRTISRELVLKHFLYRITVYKDTKFNLRWVLIASLLDLIANWPVTRLWLCYWQVCRMRLTELIYLITDPATELGMFPPHSETPAIGCVLLIAWPPMILHWFINQLKSSHSNLSVRKQTIYSHFNNEVLLLFLCG